MKVGLIGAGAVGCASLFALAMRGCAREIVVLDTNRARAEGVVTDVQYGAVLQPVVAIGAGGYDALAGAALVLIAAGFNEKTGGATDRDDPLGRLRLLDENARVYARILPQLYAVAPNAVVLVLTDPPDPLADVVRTFGFERVLSSGTYLDSLRFRVHVARGLEVAPASVEANVLGEHGKSEVFAWSSARVAGVPVLEALARTGRSRAEFVRDVERQVRDANIAIIEGIGASQYGIGMVAARIAEIVLRDERAVLPIGSYNPDYGVTLSVPSVVGATGVIRRLAADLAPDERAALERSAATLRDAVARTARTGNVAPA